MCILITDPDPKHWPNEEWNPTLHLLHPLLISLHKSIAEVMAYRKKIIIIIIIKLCSVIKMLYSTVLLVQKAKQCSFNHLYFYLKHYTYIIQCRYVSLCTKICFSGPIQKVVLISRAGQLLQLSQQFNNVAKPKSCH